MDKARIIHKDHIGAVTDLDYASTGREFVTGSFDRTLRIFNYDSGRSREVYHAKRMQIVSAVQYTVDGHYVLSGSEDMNIRLWKSVAWRQIGRVGIREERAVQYR
jgi:WD repeat and SOF domain-containing protein 1